MRAQEGDSVELKCLFRGSPPPKVTWSAAGHPVEGAVQNDQVCSRDVNILLLIFLFNNLLLLF